MFYAHSATALAALVALPLTGSAPSASAQEAILLERIGAVRMALPTETQRLPVISAAFTDRQVATNADDVRRQGGFATAGTVRWLAAASDDTVGGRFYLPAVVGAAYGDTRIATNPAEVRRQGGFATAGAVRWLPAAPVTIEAAAAKAMKVGAL